MEDLTGDCGSPSTSSEVERLLAVSGHGELDTSREPTFDHLTAIGCVLFRTQFVLISILDDHRQFFTSAVGMNRGETERAVSFCTYIPQSDELMVVLNAPEDPRFRGNSVLGKPNISFYAGAPLIDSGGKRLGSYCILDDRPRDCFVQTDRALLSRLASLTIAALEQRLYTNRLAEAEKALICSNERYRLATRATSDGIWDWNRVSDNFFWSARMRCIVGLQDKDWLGSTDEWFSRIHPADLPRIRTELEAFMGSDQLCFESEYRVRHEEGSWLWLQTRGIAVRDTTGRVQRLTGAISDVTSLGTRDGLTGLNSRLSLFRSLESHIQRGDSTKESFALLSIDLDRFKRVNDVFGHRCGDLLLVETADRIQVMIGSDPANVAARVVGDEFAVLLSSLQSQADAVASADRMIVALQQPIPCEDQEITVSVSIGIAFGGSKYTRPEQVLYDAETAMHQAKAKGGLQTAVFSEAIRQRALERLNLENELRRALATDQVCLYYQPKVLLSTGRLVGFEALMRWPNPQRGFIPPDVFIPLAEESDLILDIGRWTLRQAIGQLAQWRSAGLVSPTATVAVNLSAKQFKDESLVDNITRKLQMFNLPAACLEVEVTEGILISDVARAARILGELKKIGVGLDLDDFGTGYSSLSYLQKFAFDSLKVDRSFVNCLGSGREASAIAHSIIALGRALNLDVIAEGVETQEQAKCLRDMGCEYGQGYLFARPLPAEEVGLLLTEKFRWQITGQMATSSGPSPTF